MHIRIVFFCLLMLPSLLFAQLTESHLPIIIISTPNDIPDEPKLDAFMGIINNPSGINHIDDAFTDYNGNIGIELRGQSSLWFAKKQYGIELRDIAGEDLDASILGLPEESDFVLSAPYSDKSLMRNAVSYILAGQIMDYAPRVRYCELVLNGEYMGVYLMVEKIKRSASRLDLSKLKEEDVEGEQLQGGYIVRFDKYNNDDEVLWDSPFKPFSNAWQSAKFVASYPKFNKIQPEQKAYIRNYITNFERALDADEFAYQGKHYSEYIDVTSFIDFMLMNEITRNVDGYRISSYMYKDKSDVLKMGPVWDFNLAFGNADYCEGGQVTGWQWNFNEVCGNDGFSNHFWWKRFLEDEEFGAAMSSRWFELREDQFSNANICGIIDSLQNRIGEAEVRNFETWDILGEYVWPNQFVGATYQQEIDYLKSWIEDRLDFIDDEMEQFVYTKETSLGFGISPNPNRGSFILDVPDLGGASSSLEIFDAVGKLVVKVNLSSNNKEFITLDLEAGVYVCKLNAEVDNNQVIIKQMVVF